MKDYEIFDLGWSNGWATLEDMIEAVNYKIISEEEYEKIVGENSFSLTSRTM